MTDAEYFDIVSRARPILDDFLPAWVTYTITLGGGPFLLDAALNLDNARFTP
jgi:hypothetical protein